MRKLRPAAWHDTLTRPLHLPCRWAGIANYIVATSDERSLAACLAMHLPCFNATSYLVQPLESAGEEAQFHSNDFFPVTWVKPKLTRCVGRGAAAQRRRFLSLAILFRTSSRPGASRAHAVRTSKRKAARLKVSLKDTWNSITSSLLKCCLQRQVLLRAGLLLFLRTTELTICMHLQGCLAPRLSRALLRCGHCISAQGLLALHAALPRGP